MPLYDYRCTACGREIEVMHAIGAHGPEACETCGGAMRKALSSPAIHFKGSGWAKKDAAASARKAKPASESKKDGDSDTAKKGAESSDRGSSDAGSAKAEPKATGSDSKAAAGAGSASD
jgi:putative FmdB family regulatory protein